MDMHSRYERDGMLVEEFHQLGEVGERAGQPVDLFKIGGQSTFPIAMHYATRVFSSSTSTHQR